MYVFIGPRLLNKVDPDGMAAIDDYISTLPEARDGELDSLIDQIGGLAREREERDRRLGIASGIIPVFSDPKDAIPGDLVINPGFEYPGTPDGAFGGWEVLIGIGGYGRTTVFCCDEKMNLKRMRFRKVCVGYGTGASKSYGVVEGMSGKDCNRERYSGWFYESGGTVFGVAVGGDTGLRDSIGKLPGWPSGVGEVGGGAGLPHGVKVMLCRYKYIQGSETTERCGCTKQGNLPRDQF